MKVLQFICFLRPCK